MDNYDGYVKIGTKIDDKDLKPQLQKTKTNILSTMKTIGTGTAVAAAAGITLAWPGAESRLGL